LSRFVANLIKKRREELVGVGSGEEENSSKYNIVIDEWIKVVDDDAEALQTRKEGPRAPRRRHGRLPICQTGFNPSISLEGEVSYKSVTIWSQENLSTLASLLDTKRESQQAAI